jgi:hypothetical protein
VDRVLRVHVDAEAPVTGLQLNSAAVHLDAAWSIDWARSSA